MFTTPVPSQSSSVTSKFRTVTAKFGDGYRQDAPDGINDRTDVWDLRFEHLQATQRDIVKNFFDTVKTSTSFTWQAPGDSVVKTWKATSGLSRTNMGITTTLAITIEQVF